VTVVEYADFECPHCQRAHPVIERVLESFAPRVRFVFRHFPVTSLHPLAQGAALASEAAGRQGKFWDMQRRLMEAGGALRPDDLVRCAEALALDVTRFKRDVADPALAKKIQQGKLLGARSGVNGTPTLFINGVRYDAEPEEPQLMEAVRAALRAADAT
jgi:protein-disulfide isomerase